MVTTVVTYSPANMPILGGEYPLGLIVALPLDVIDDDPDNEHPDPSVGSAELKASLKADGQIEPILVFPAPDTPGRFMCQAGHRRRYAAGQLGWTHIQAIIVPPPVDARERHVKRLVANATRADIDPMAKARTLKALLAEEQVDQAVLAPRVGLSQSGLANTLRLLKLSDPIQTLVAGGQLAPSTALELLALDEAPIEYSGKVIRSIAEEQLRLAQDAVATGISAKGMRGRVAEVKSGNARQRQYAAQQAQWQEQNAAQNAQAAERERLRKLAQKVQAGTATPEETTTVQAAVDQAAAAEAKEQAARAREQGRLAARQQRADAVINDLIGYNPAAPTVEMLRVVALFAACESTSGTSDREPAAWTARIDVAAAAGNTTALLQIICEAVRACVTLDPDKRAIGGYHMGWRWKEALDKRYFLNAAIADALLAEKLITGQTHKKLLTEGAKRPAAPPPAAEAAPATLPVVAEIVADDPAPPPCDECGLPTYHDGDSARCLVCDDGRDLPLGDVRIVCRHCDTPVPVTLVPELWRALPHGRGFRRLERGNGQLLTAQGAFYCAICGVDVVQCRTCGCTDEGPCAGGCAWATKDLCTSCVDGSSNRAEVQTWIRLLVGYTLAPNCRVCGKQTTPRDQDAWAAPGICRGCAGTLAARELTLEAIAADMNARMDAVDGVRT